MRGREASSNGGRVYAAYPAGGGYDGYGMDPVDAAVDAASCLLTLEVLCAPDLYGHDHGYPKLG